MYISDKKNEAWSKMGDTGSDEYQNNVNKENYWFGYYRALEDLEFLKLDEFLEQIIELTDNEFERFNIRSSDDCLRYCNITSLKIALENYRNNGA